MNVKDLRLQARQLQYQFGLDEVVVDYVQLMDEPSIKGNRVAELFYSTRQMKSMALELKIVMVQGAQLNRELERRADKRPILADLRDSGSLEQDSDVVAFLYRDEMYNEQTEFPNQAEVIISKHRNGPVGTISLYFEKHITKFIDANLHRVDLSDLV